MLIDLDVTNIANRIYALQDDVISEPRADEVSRLDWEAAHAAAIALAALIAEKLAQPAGDAA